MKKLTLLLICMIIIGLLAGCAGTPVVYYTNCTCPTDSHDTAVTPNDTPDLGDDELKTGLYIGTNLSNSKDASTEGNGAVVYDITIVAVTVDGKGIIRSCLIDSVPATVAFDASGVIQTDLSAEILTKNELGDNYGMRAKSQIGYEWDEQVAAFAKHAVGKTVDQLKNGSINESGYAADVDLASSASINLFPYIFGIEGAVNNAQPLGAKAGDELRLASISGLEGSKSATDETDGLAQFDVNVVALTVNGDTITSCTIDSLQAKVNFNNGGSITTDLTAQMLTKNQLGENYGMSNLSSIGAEWNEQAAAFSKYVTNKTAADVAGIAISEDFTPTEADLVSSVTIKINGFQDLIAKALG